MGLGSHRRWCEVAVGRSAAMFGKWSEQAEALGDSVGANDPGTANHLYAAASRLREEAYKRRDAYVQLRTS